MRNTLEMANQLADELEKRRQPGAMWMAAAARSLAVTHLEIRQALIDAGICPDCLQAPQHHYDEPFATCACGTGEDTGERPMQRLQRLEAAMPDEESLQVMADLVSIGGQKAEEVITRGPRSWDLLKPDRLRYLATAGYSRSFDVIKKLKGVACDRS